MVANKENSKMSLIISTLFVLQTILADASPEFLSFEWKPSVQEFVVPQGGGSFYVRAWGAGGGGSALGSGAAGDYVSGMLELQGGSILKIVVGKGGERSESGEPTGIYLNSVAPENALLLAAGGEKTTKSRLGKVAGQGETQSFADGKLVQDRFFLAGEDGAPTQDARPAYRCSKTYKEGTGVGRKAAKGGNGLVVLSRGFQDFCYTGANQLFTVPGGVTSVSMYAWGGGGGGSTGTTRTPGSAGGFATRTLTVEPGDRLLVIVGGGGLRPLNATSGVATYGGGGCGTYSGGHGSGGGGGRSAVRQLYTIAAGGGGSGSGGEATTAQHANTGVGGGASGGNGASSIDSTGGSGGNGASQSAGGTAGVYMGDGTSYPGTAGTLLTGGNGHLGNNRPGGGGGGGLYGGGGGGGGFSGADSWGGSGGGGSSFPSTGSLSGSGQAPGNDSDTGKPRTAGRGGEKASHGGDGYLRVTW